MSFAKTFLVAALLVAACQAVSIKWTGYANNNQWSTNTNWYPDQVPGPQDDVTIDSGSVIITTPVSINSLGMGNSFSASANLTVLNALTVFETLTVQGNGNLLLTSGASAVSGTVNIDGTLVFSAGSVSGTWTVSKDATADLGTGDQKTFSACGFTASGSVTASGLWVLQSSSAVSITSVSASGDFELQNGDSSAVSLTITTLTYNGGGTFLVQLPVAVTTFNLMAGNVTMLDGVSLSGVLTIPAGSIVRTVAQKPISLKGGVAGSGELHVLGTLLTLGASNFTSGLLVAESGTLVFGSASAVGTLLVTGAMVNLTADVSAVSVTLNAGSVNGADQLTADTLIVNTPGFNLRAPIVATGSVITQSSVVALMTKNSGIRVASGATMSVSGTVQITDKGTLTNDGTISVSGSLSCIGIAVTGTGSYAVSGALGLVATQFSAGSVTLSGSGSFSGQATEVFTISKVSADGEVEATIGDYTLTCPGGYCGKVKTAGIPNSNFNFQKA